MKRLVSIRFYLIILLIPITFCILTSSNTCAGINQWTSAGGRVGRELGLPARVREHTAPEVASAATGAGSPRGAFGRRVGGLLAR